MTVSNKEIDQIKAFLTLTGDLADGTNSDNDELERALAQYVQRNDIKGYNPDINTATEFIQGQLLFAEHRVGIANKALSLPDNSKVKQGIVELLYPYTNIAASGYDKALHAAAADTQNNAEHRVQRYLADKSVYPGSVDGGWGKITRASGIRHIRRIGLDGKEPFKSLIPIIDNIHSLRGNDEYTRGLRVANYKFLAALDQHIREQQNNTLGKAKEYATNSQGWSTKAHNSIYKIQQIINNETPGRVPEDGQLSLDLFDAIKEYDIKTTYNGKASMWLATYAHTAWRLFKEDPEIRKDGRIQENVEDALELMERRQEQRNGFVPKDRSTSSNEQTTIREESTQKITIEREKAMTAIDPVTAKIQTFLKYHGYDVGKAGVDGDWGDDTTAALRKYNQDHGTKLYKSTAVAHFEQKLQDPNAKAAFARKVINSESYLETTAAASLIGPNSGIKIQDDTYPNDAYDVLQKSIPVKRQMETGFEENPFGGEFEGFGDENEFFNDGVNAQSAGLPTYADVTALIGKKAEAYDTPVYTQGKKSEISHSRFVAEVFNLAIKDVKSQLGLKGEFNRASLFDQTPELLSNKDIKKAYQDETAYKKLQTRNQGDEIRIQTGDLLFEKYSNKRALVITKIDAQDNLVEAVGPNGVLKKYQLDWFTDGNVEKLRDLGLRAVGDTAEYLQETGVFDKDVLREDPTINNEGVRNPLFDEIKGNLNDGNGATRQKGGKEKAFQRGTLIPHNN